MKKVPSQMAVAGEELNYFEIKKDLENTINALSLPEGVINFSFEKKEFNLQLQLSDISDESFVDLLSLAKKHVENWRIHTFERGYLSLQALNSNIFETDALLENIKVRLSGIYGEKLLEISKKGNPTQSELSLIAALLKHFTGTKKKTPLEMLIEAGCTVYKPADETKGFSDFAGYKQVVQEVKETIIMPLARPEVFDSITKSTRESFESNRPKAVLFAGPPGVGKTTMARIIAKESGVPLVYVPLENIMSAYYGESSKRLAMIFDIASRARDKGLILFLDEIDSLAPSRNEKLFEATRRMLSVLLRKIDGLETSGSTLTIGATNRKQDLDAALLSRFDTIVEFPNPSFEDIQELLKLYARHLSGKERADVAKKLESQSPRTIIDICKRAERMQARELIQENSKQVGPPAVAKYLDAAQLRISAGV